MDNIKKKLINKLKMVQIQSNNNKDMSRFHLNSNEKIHTSSQNI